MVDDSMYDDWIARRKAAEQSAELTDRIMSTLEAREVSLASTGRGKADRLAAFSVRVNESSSARIAACVAALLVGCVPFLFVAYVAQTLVF